MNILSSHHMKQISCPQQSVFKLPKDQDGTLEEFTYTLNRASLHTTRTYDCEGLMLMTSNVREQETGIVRPEARLYLTRFQDPDESIESPPGTLINKETSSLFEIFDANWGNFISKVLEISNREKFVPISS